jgi:hypothetical protein
VLVLGIRPSHSYDGIRFAAAMRKSQDLCDISRVEVVQIERTLARADRASALSLRSE